MVIAWHVVPRMADTFRVTETEGMGPRLRGDDAERVVRMTPAQPLGSSPSRLAMIRSTIRLGRIAVIKCRIGSGAIW